MEISDQKVSAGITLAITPSKLRSISECSSTREIWSKLESTFQTKDQARKATIPKHLNASFDTVANLKEIGEEIRNNFVCG